MAIASYFNKIRRNKTVNVSFQLDDTALQLYKEGDYGAYLDLDASINEQQEEFENFQSKWVLYLTAHKKWFGVLAFSTQSRGHSCVNQNVVESSQEQNSLLYTEKLLNDLQFGKPSYNTKLSIYFGPM